MPLPLGGEEFIAKIKAEGAAARAAVGLYKLTHTLESAWFQPLRL
jgi:hypothetical protein